MNITLPKDLHAFVVAQSNAGGYNSVSEYLVALIEENRTQKAKAVIESELLKGVASGVAPMTGDDWAKLRARAVSVGL
jgi:antitoxin ParD1/3/4